MSELLWELPYSSVKSFGSRQALAFKGEGLGYEDFADVTEKFASVLIRLGVGKLDRVAVYADKRLETVIAMFGAARAGAVFVPVNPILKAEQLAYIAADCNVRVLVTSPDRLRLLDGVLARCPDLRHVIVMGDGDLPELPGVATHGWQSLLDAAVRGAMHRVIDTDVASILYTSGSTGQPKGVVLSHRNMVAGARSVASYLENTPEDRVLAVLPLSFDYGLSQLTTAFSVGACAVLHNHLFAQDVVRMLARERITGLAAVPPLWMQLAALQWPESIDSHLRYFTNSGGAMPTATLAQLRARAPSARPFLMYGLTEAFRSTYLPPQEVDRRPTSIGKAIPNAEILVLREDGSECAPNEPGELVHRGALVSLGYWNDPEKTNLRFRVLPGARKELPLPEIAVFSGDTVTRDEEGFLYFVSRRDEMIKTSGYRVSPTEVEEVVLSTGLVAEAAALGVSHAALGQAIVVVAQAAVGCEPDSEALLRACAEKLPAYMLPKQIDWLPAALPRNANGKIDRKTLASERASLFENGQ